MTVAPTKEWAVKNPSSGIMDDALDIIYDLAYVECPFITGDNKFTFETIFTPPSSFSSTRVVMENLAHQSADHEKEFCIFTDISAHHAFNTFKNDYLAGYYNRFISIDGHLRSTMDTITQYHELQKFGEMRHKFVGVMNFAD